jgi:hypothetical protein
MHFLQLKAGYLKSVKSTAMIKRRPGLQAFVRLNVPCNAAYTISAGVF